MSFCTAVNCIDGRVQLPVITYLTKRFGVSYVDMVNHPGVNLVLAEQTDPQAVESILKGIKISVEKHDSAGIAVVGHWDCGGNPADKQTQTAHTLQAVEFLAAKFPSTKIIALWVDQDWKVTEIA